MPLIKGIGDELAKLASAGAASWAKRSARRLATRCRASAVSNPACSSWRMVQVQCNDLCPKVKQSDRLLFLPFDKSCQH